ncbi:GL22651 [Drosophila persimilis]|uniref:GL22651 n=1 Tax=Drosophila persimilis TaxID=7234 RepID=B4IR46_DROPE|nr:GL22651 [Drosophila persimilis]
MVLLVLPGVIDELVLGWDFLRAVGAVVTCAGHRVVIPAQDRERGGQEERLSVAKAEAGETGPEYANKTDTTLRTAAREVAESTNGNEGAREEPVEDFLARELEAFAKIEGVSNVAVHTITMSDPQPIKQRYYPKGPKSRFVTTGAQRGASDDPRTVLAFFILQSHNSRL